MLSILLSLMACDSEQPSTPEAPQPPTTSATTAPSTTASDTPAPPAQGEQTWEQLRADHAEATSFLRSDWNKYNENYHPSYVLDGNPKTAWVEGVDGNGEQERITIPLTPLKSASAVKLRIRNGYQKSDTLFTANAVPRNVTITARSSSRVHSIEVELPYETGWQEAIVELPEGFGLDAVSLRIDSVYPGSKYQDTCISDIEVFVDSQVPHNAAQEDARHKTLLTWVTKRVETAQYFAAKPSSYPFSSTQLSSSSSESTDDAVEPAMIGPREAMAEMKALEGWEQLSASRDIPAFPDGLYLSKGLLPLFLPDALSFTETAEAAKLHESQAEEIEDNGEIIEVWSNKLWRSNHKVSRTDSGTPKLVYFWEKEIEEGRGSYESRTDYLASYAETGELQWLYLVLEGDSEVGSERQESLYTFVRSGGQISVIEAKEISDFGEGDWKEHSVQLYRYTGS